VLSLLNFLFLSFVALQLREEECCKLINAVAAAHQHTRRIALHACKKQAQVDRQVRGPSLGQALPHRLHPQQEERQARCVSVCCLLLLVMLISITIHKCMHAHEMV
jgi:hypothetical protein